MTPGCTNCQWAYSGPIECLGLNQGGNDDYCLFIVLTFDGATWTLNFQVCGNSSSSGLCKCCDTEGNDTCDGSYAEWTYTSDSCTFSGEDMTGPTIVGLGSIVTLWNWSAATAVLSSV
jgi:hypothetical protein